MSCGPFSAQTQATGSTPSTAPSKYPFRSKEELIRELIVDGARAIDDRRIAWLGEREVCGGPHSVVEVMQALVRTSVADPPPETGECYNRFIVGLLTSHRKLVMDALENQWNSGYLRCLDHLRRLTPHVPSDLCNRRLVFMGAALGGIMAGRETELADRSRAHPMWSDPLILDQAAQALAAIVES